MKRLGLVFVSLCALSIGILWVLIFRQSVIPSDSRPYAVALFQYDNGEVAHAALVPGGKNLADCRQVADAVRSKASAAGVAVSAVCVSVPDAPVVASPSREESDVPLAPQSTI